MIVLRFDGLFRSFPGSQALGVNAGILCYGWLITRRGVVAAQGHGAFARSRLVNSSVAEYLALIEGLDAAIDLGVSREMVEVRGDAKTIIDQMRGACDVNAASIKPLYRQASALANRIERVQWVWSPRKNNREADSLSRRAMHQVSRNRCAYQSLAEAMLNFPAQHRQLAPVLDLRVYF
jgi:ribonuclease HI